MRRQLTTLRLLPLYVIAAAAMLLVAWKAVERFNPAEESPFAMWDFRAGVPFEELDSRMRRQARRGFTCHELFRTVRYCEMRAYGIAGLVRAIVDPHGHVARIQFVPDSASPAMREEGRRLAAMWNQLRDPVGDPPNARDPMAATTRWATEDERWGALIRYGRLGKTPVAVQLTDRPAFARIASSPEPLGPVALVMNKLADSAEVRSTGDLARALKLVQEGRAIDAGLATAAPAALGATTPFCEPVALDLGVQTGESRPDKFADDVTAMLPKAVERLYAGSRIFFGMDTRLIDATGRSERVSFGPVARDDAKGLVAIGVRFPTRMTTAMDRLREKAPADFCRATAEVLIARKAPNGSLEDVQRVSVGDDAQMSDIVRLEFQENASDATQLRVRYTAVYGTDRWAGSLDWDEVLSLESPRPQGRALLTFSHITEETTMDTPGTVVTVRRQPHRLELATLEKHEWGYLTRTVAVPISAGNGLDGVLTLQHLLQPPNAMAKK